MFFNVNLRSVLSRYIHLLCVQTDDAADDIMLKFGICLHQDHLPILENHSVDFESWLSSKKTQEVCGAKNSASNMGT